MTIETKIMMLMMMVIVVMLTGCVYNLRYREHPNLPVREGLHHRSSICIRIQLLLTHYLDYFFAAFSALTLLVGRQEEHPEKLCDEVLVWLSVWSEVQIVCLWSN